MSAWIMITYVHHSMSCVQIPIVDVKNQTSTMTVLAPLEARAFPRSKITKTEWILRFVQRFKLFLRKFSFQWSHLQILVRKRENLTIALIQTVMLETIVEWYRTCWKKYVSGFVNVIPNHLFVVEGYTVEMSH